MQEALENPVVIENALGVAAMVANLGQLVDVDLAIETVAEHLGVSRDVVTVALGIAREAIK
jgi:3-hydroxyacyl-CoA dehydrogenase